MACFLAQKFAPGTAEADWLVTQAPDGLVEWTNWGDARWGVAVRDGQASASGRNALGLLLEIIRARLLKGLLPPAAAENQWSALQASLVPRMTTLSEARRQG